MTEVLSMHDEVQVQRAMLLRVDGTLSALPEEQITRMNSRIRDLEAGE